MLFSQNNTYRSNHVSPLGFALQLAFALAVACGDDGGSETGEPDAAPLSGPSTALLEIPQPGQANGDGFFSLPYPNDLRLLSDGKIDLEHFPRPNALLEDYVDAIAAKQKGFGISAPILARFEGPLSQESIPTNPEEYLNPDSPIFLVNVERGSERYGEKLPLECQFRADSGEVIGTNRLACMPFPGFLMEEGAHYAWVASARLLAEDGSAVKPASQLQALLATQGQGRAHEVYAPLRQYLAEISFAEEVVSATVFTTQRSTELMGKIREAVQALPEPEPEEIKWMAEKEGYAIYRGRFPSPNFQEGDYPYNNVEKGGSIAVDAQGNPQLQEMLSLRFSLTVPQGAMPEDGWPLVIYAHGTGGDYLSYEENGTAARLAKVGVAVISIDQVMHGDRLSSGDAQTLFFNFQNPYSTRGNVIQAGLEDFQLLRLAKNIDYEDRREGGRKFFFNSDKFYFFGHSQGASTGTPFLAHEPEVKGAILSGAGGHIVISLLNKTEPFDVASALALIVRDPMLDKFNPVLGMIQAYFEPSDALVYGPLIVQNPPLGEAKSVFQPLGIVDRYTPIPTIEALATAMGSDLVEPMLEEVEGLELLGNQLQMLPMSQNRGGATVALAQYRQVGNSDGHFVSFRSDAAKAQITSFIQSHVENGSFQVLPAED